MHVPPQILIVDDNETNRCLLTARLDAEGYETVEAENGEKALEIVREIVPDVILLDVMMPKIDGFEVCRRLKDRYNTWFVPIIMVTARTDSQDVVTGLNAGADEYLTKPIDHAALVARVARCSVSRNCMIELKHRQSSSLCGIERLSNAFRSKLCKSSGLAV